MYVGQKSEIDFKSQKTKIMYKFNYLRQIIIEENNMKEESTEKYNWLSLLSQNSYSFLKVSKIRVNYKKKVFN